jgi:hypothetical protein
MASVNLNSGPAFSAMNSWPSSWNVPVISVPALPGLPSGYRLVLRIFEFLKSDV